MVLLSICTLAFGQETAGVEVGGLVAILIATGVLLLVVIYHKLCERKRKEKSIDPITAGQAPKSGGVGYDEVHSYMEKVFRKKFPEIPFFKIETVEEGRIFGYLCVEYKEDSIQKIYVNGTPAFCATIKVAGGEYNYVDPIYILKENGSFVVDAGHNSLLDGLSFSPKMIVAKGGTLVPIGQIYFPVPQDEKPVGKTSPIF